MKITELILAIVFITIIVLVVSLRSQERYTKLPEVFTVTVQNQHSVGMQFFEIRFADGGAATMAIDADVPFYKVLRDAKGPQTLTLQPRQLQEIER